MRSIVSPSNRNRGLSPPGCSAKGEKDDGKRALTKADVRKRRLSKDDGKRTNDGKSTVYPSKSMSISHAHAGGNAREIFVEAESSVKHSHEVKTGSIVNV